MTFHRANNRRAIKDRERESYLGSLPGDAPLPIEPVPMELPDIDARRFRFWFGLLAALFVLAALGILASKSIAHGSADWINKGGYKNSAGEQCCGERDCAELADGDVKITASGYLIRSLNELVPFHQATPAPDGKYWRCAWGGQRKCFFAPPGNS